MQKWKKVRTYVSFKIPLDKTGFFLNAYSISTFKVLLFYAKENSNFIRKICIISLIFCSFIHLLGAYLSQMSIRLKAKLRFPLTMCLVHDEKCPSLCLLAKYRVFAKWRDGQELRHTLELLSCPWWFHLEIFINKTSVI